MRGWSELLGQLGTAYAPLRHKRGGRQASGHERQRPATVVNMQHPLQSVPLASPVPNVALSWMKGTKRSSYETRLSYTSLSLS